jgi:hypothetical protein
MIDVTGDAAVISDPLKVPITAQRRESGGVFIRSARSFIALSDAELGRLYDFTEDEPQLGELQTFTP